MLDMLYLLAQEGAKSYNCCKMPIFLHFFLNANLSIVILEHIPLISTIFLLKGCFLSTVKMKH